MVTRCSIIGCVYSGKPAINMLEKTIFRDGENVQERNSHIASENIKQYNHFQKLAVSYKSLKFPINPLLSIYLKEVKI